MRAFSPFLICIFLLQWLLVLSSFLEHLSPSASLTALPYSGCHTYLSAASEFSMSLAKTSFMESDQYSFTKPSFRRVPAWSLMYYSHCLKFLKIFSLNFYFVSEVQWENQPCTWTEKTGAIWYSHSLPPLHIWSSNVRWAQKTSGSGIHKSSSRFTVSQSIQSLSHVWLFATPWTAACQASLSITNSQSLLKLMSI